MILKVLIISIIIYIPNSLHFPTSLGLPGINVFNLLFLSLLFYSITKKEKTPYKSPLSGSLKFYYLSAFIALLISIQTTSHLVENVTTLKNIVIYSSLYFIIFHLVDTKEQAKFYIKVIYFVVFLMCLEIIKEKFALGIGSSKRVAGAFGDDASAANYAGVFLAIFLPLLLKNFLYKCKDFNNPYISLSIFMMGVFSIFYTYSRQAYGSILATSILNFSKKNKLLLLFFIVMIFNSSLWLPESVTERIEGTKVESTDTGEEKLDDSTESRLVIWGEAYNNLITHNPQGIGLNEFQDRIDPYMPTWIHARDAHNSFILVLTESGILGLIAFLYLFLKMYNTGGMIKRDSPDPTVRMLGEGYQLIIIAVILGNIYSSTFYSPEVMGNFWILSAIIHKYYYLSLDSTELTDEHLGDRNEK